ncbi:uncharacterized protein THITE_2121689 [Thermothielavioides terrestris NRRL 8126]|uniref:Uncharacterized protein n=1 Tax=Thermothielavioides terrestris (strain ATCC 38088 / NRRL 8126) TaxID=578455 RepID=G2RF76_THETT|nr:uncharacterized protein THITE_2121689 [Thermothielavioides terrestris NRRL 8126]AEO70359.1 hypothetical protein THITE_2121689 [Thermothielavioides terrestris NRRL 8126]
MTKAAAAGRQIYIHPRPTTLSHARNNLRAFSDEAVTRPQPPGFIPVNSNVQLVDCLGWTEFKGSEINAQFKRARVFDRECKVDGETYPAIVYQFVADDSVPEVNTILDQLDFFHATGFVTVMFKGDNWAGKGMLVDFSDIVSYHTGFLWWRPSHYAALAVGFREVVEDAARNGLLGPRPKVIERSRTPPHLRRHATRARTSTRDIPPPPPPPPRIPLPEGDFESRGEELLEDKPSEPKPAVPLDARPIPQSSPSSMGEARWGGSRCPG